MTTIARQIDALGGTGKGEFHAGYTAALNDAEPIAENADALVEELLECITDVLDGKFGAYGIDHWALHARRLVVGVKHRRAQ